MNEAAGSSKVVLVSFLFFSLCEAISWTLLDTAFVKQTKWLLEAVVQCTWMKSKGISSFHINERRFKYSWLIFPEIIKVMRQNPATGNNTFAGLLSFRFCFYCLEDVSVLKCPKQWESVKKKKGITVYLLSLIS